MKVGEHRPDDRPVIYSVVVVGNSHERPIFQGIFQWGRKLLWIATKAKLPETERRKSHEELVDLLTRMKECAIVSRGQRVSAVSLKLKCKSTFGERRR